MKRKASYVTNPSTWEPGQLQHWLKTHENGRFKVFGEILKHFKGEELYEFSNEQWNQLEPVSLAKSLRYTFMGMCAIADAESYENATENLHVLELGNNPQVPLLSTVHEGDTVVEVPDDSKDHTKTIAARFPPPIDRPNIYQILLLTALAIALLLAGTVFKQQLYERLQLTPQELYKYASIPILSALFTYVHIWLALYMTFYPLEFRGCCQIPSANVGLGWQGIIPFKAEAMARKSVQLMTTQLMDVKEIFARIEPHRVAVELEPVLYGTIGDIIEEMALKYNPRLWRLLPVSVKEEIVQRVQEDTPAHIESLMLSIRENIEEVFDIEDMVTTNMMKDKQLLVNMFITCGYDELAFIRNSGAYMGGLFGLAQMVLWIFYTNRIVVFPVFGLLVGTTTNWLALKVIFEPIEPIHICCCKLHGFFLRRQEKVAAVYGRMVADDVLNSKNIIDAILQGPTSDRFFELVYNNVQEAVNAGASTVTDKVLRMGIGADTYYHMKEDICQLISLKFPASLRHIESYATKAMNLEVTLREQMRKLSSREFEGLLHPAFQEDEWKLVLMGGILGLIIGLVQAFGINV